MKKFTLFIIYLITFSLNAQVIVSEDFENIEINELPVGWSSNDGTGLSTFVDDYYGGCDDNQYVSNNLYNLQPLLLLTTPNYTNLSPLPKEVSYQLRIYDYYDETPVDYNFGTITFSYSMDNGSSWTSLGVISNANFTPTVACQEVSYIYPGSLIAAQINLKFKWELSYSGVGDYEVLIDNFMLSESPTASISELDKSKLKVYPNPVTDVLNIDYDLPISKLTIYDLLGRNIGEFSNTDNLNSLNVTNLSLGTYLLRIEAEDNSQSTIKFIKK